ncbi:hypothetical protein K7W03_22405 [Sphingobium sp. PNB]|uniref:hypothetical protein n=1 Tax=Sphingobium sp. PNB TaxID=863934 RepID=UPI001CA3C3DA|nr:hypothetical protein [Sphingobium sp. PNB]MCB4862347.1 hypothetical protein [Sphingobium sp. PNB]
MATLTAARAAPTFPVPSLSVPAGVLQVAWGLYNLAANPSQNDVIEFCRVPAGATVIGGWLQGADIDTGTETLDIDIGWAANGTDNADTDGFGNLGVLTGDVSVHTPVAGIFVPFANVIQDAGYKTFAAETKIIGTVNAAANAGGTGVLKVVVLFV